MASVNWELPELKAGSYLVGRHSIDSSNRHYYSVSLKRDSSVLGSLPLVAAENQSDALQQIKRLREQLDVLEHRLRTEDTSDVADPSRWVSQLPQDGGTDERVAWLERSKDEAIADRVRASIKTGETPIIRPACPACTAGKNAKSGPYMVTAQVHHSQCPMHPNNKTVTPGDL